MSPIAPKATAFRELAKECTSNSNTLTHVGPILPMERQHTELHHNETRMAK